MAIRFTESDRSTIGVEWELQLIDMDSDDLRQCADTVTQMAQQRGGSELIHGEMLRNTIEIVSRKRTTVAECAQDLAEGIEFLEPILVPLRIELASAGAHPFADPAYQRVSDSARYAELVNRTQFWGRQMLLFGTHVHVGVEDVRKVLPIINFLASKLGQLQALFASSPFWAGVDTGYCDNRAMVFQQLPTAGVPQLFPDWQQLEGFTRDMLKTGVISSFDEIRWDIRPSPQLGTIEVRVCDAVSNLTEIRALAALVHCLVEYASRQLDEGQPLPTLPPWFVAENKWRAARYGMDAILIDNSEGDESLITASLPTWLASLEQVAADLGCAQDLAEIPEIVHIGVGYQRQRSVAKQAGNLEAVVAHLRQEMVAGRPLRPHTEVSTKGVHAPAAGNRGWIGGRESETDAEVRGAQPGDQPAPPPQ
ncbi:MAG: glutamate--cysteine ligase [Actinomycetaceae bacterium]|nr:glutamate--cysteine ligase [Actinomycetaceae bacterium]